MADTTAHSRIVAWFVARLEAAALLDGVKVFRSRQRALPQDIARALVVRKLDSQPQGTPMLGQGVTWLTIVRVEAMATGGPNAAPDEAPDELMLLAHAALQAALVAEPTLGGLAMAVNPPRLGWDDTDEFERPLGAAIAQYPVIHRTQARSLAPAP